MGYNLATKSGHNMFTMASLLQKAVRRGDERLAGYAACELYGSYSGMMWNRMITISSEDCWGILTKELVALRTMDAESNKGIKGYNKNPLYVSRAIALLCKSLKSRDGCYFSCNFIFATNERYDEKITNQDIEKMKRIAESIPPNAFYGDRLKSASPLQFDFEFECEEQVSMFGESESSIQFEDDREKDVFRNAALLKNSILNLDMENIGFAIGQLRMEQRQLMWNTVLYIAAKELSGVSAQEIIGLKLADDRVNGSRKPEAKDEIFISKAVMVLCYEICGDFDSLCSYKAVSPYGLIDWGKYRVDSIFNQTLPDNIVPEWVYDVHTIKGKRAGKTDWEMNIVEQAALHPLQPAFFDDGSWSPRYDYKHVHGICTEKEYLDSLEYRKTRLGNPVKRLKA